MVIGIINISLYQFSWLRSFTESFWGSLREIGKEHPSFVAQSIETGFPQHVENQKLTPIPN